MGNMVVFFDGGEVCLDNKIYKNMNRLHSWGMIIHHNGKSVEHFSARYSSNQLKGHHEIIAFLETLIQIREMGVDPTTASYYTDCDRLGYAQCFLTEANGQRNKREAFYEMLWDLCCRKDNSYDMDLFDLAVTVLQTARFTKVKAHKKVMDNLRVDYLCRVARRRLHVNEHPSAFLPMKKWLRVSQFVSYNHKGEEQEWHPPFTEREEICRNLQLETKLDLSETSTVSSAPSNQYFDVAA